MGTPYPTESERKAIQASANRGDESARQYLELLDACMHILEGSNGISLARGLVGEHNDVYGQAIDDALSELMPVVFRISPGGWDSLKWYVPEEIQQAVQQIAQPTGSYEADQQRARQEMTANQEYLQSVLRQAVENNDPEVEARITLEYHQAMLKALMFLTRGTDCGCQSDIDSLAAIANELNQQREEYTKHPERFGVSEMKAFIAECMSKLEHVKNLCQVCLERLQFNILTNFRAIHGASSEGASSDFMD
jgi:hypothetical protein